MLKTLERSFERFLKKGPLIKHPLAASMYTYREGISTETAFHHLVSKVEVQLQAFDSTSKVAVKQAMIRHEVSEAHLDWVEHMLADRNLIDSHGDTTIEDKPVKDCPQGGAFISIFVVPHGKRPFKGLNNRKVYGYADDIAN
jgi:hypothetical protein